jgi:hypothetical protein
MNGVKFYCEEVYRRNDLSSTIRVWRQNFAGKFKRGDGLLPGHRRKRLQEIVERRIDSRRITSIG